jgi:mono/diheme cytochrome c family protein
MQAIDGQFERGERVAIYIGFVRKDGESVLVNGVVEWQFVTQRETQFPWLSAACTFALKIPPSSGRLHKNEKTQRKALAMKDSTTSNRLKLSLFVLLLLLLGGCGSDSANTEGQADPAQLATGKRLYEANCAACHGVKGEGQPNWKVPVKGIYPAPPHDSSGHTWHHPDQQLLEIIARGTGMPNSPMPAYGETLAESERAAVLEYIKTFWGIREQEFQAQITRQRNE